jgi:hypothetical protein
MEIEIDLHAQLARIVGGIGASREGGSLNAIEIHQIDPV